MIMNFACAGGIFIALCNGDKDWSNYVIAFIAGGVLLGNVLT